MLATGLILIAAGATQARFRYITHRRAGRRYYWTTSAIGIACFAVGVGKLWPNAVLSTLMFIAVVVGSAYLITPYIKIRGRIYAASPENRQPDP
ncbi:hypothetical protein [Mycobacterium sp. Marseille-P9652]|uniref:hypothetical protein n=1 Tax=Mycobacterium sp. Marseille-P9652 TaxID=2654950 RepID=UPI0018D15041